MTPKSIQEAAERAAGMLQHFCLLRPDVEASQAAPVIAAEFQPAAVADGAKPLRVAYDQLVAALKVCKQSARDNGSLVEPEGYADLSESGVAVADACWLKGIEEMETAVLSWAYDELHQSKSATRSDDSKLTSVEEDLADALKAYVNADDWTAGVEKVAIAALARYANTGRLCPTPPAEPSVAKGENEADLKVFEQRKNEPTENAETVLRRLAAEPSAEGDAVAAVRAWIAGRQFHEIYDGSGRDDSQIYFKEDVETIVVALKHANATIENISKKLGMERSHATALEAELEGYKREADSIRKSETRLEAELKAVKQERDEAIASTVRLRGSRDDKYAALMTRIARLTADLKDAQDHAEKSLDAQRDSDERAFKAEAELKEAREYGNQSRKDFEEAHRKLLDSEARATALQEQLDSARQACTRNYDEANASQEALHDAQADLAASRKQVAELTEELAKHKAAFTPNGALARENEELREKLNLRPLALSVGQLAGKHEQALARITALEAALNDIASWEEGSVVTGGFDEPGSAARAREALAPASAPTETEKET